MDIIYTRVESLREDVNKKLDDFENKFERVEQRLSTLEAGGSVGNMAAVQSNTEKATKSLQYKAIDQEARSIRNNVIVHNLQEVENEDTRAVFADFV